MRTANIHISLCIRAAWSGIRCLLKQKVPRRNMTAVRTPHDNNEYPYEPVHPRSLIWNSLCLKKKKKKKKKKNAPKHESCPYATWEEQIYLYEPAHPRNLIWNSLSVEKKKCAETWQLDNSEYSYEPAHPRSLIWNLLSV